ncbi:MAG: hypothetical protein EBR82_38665 [Caulobacteraceae bacterium]|nr:hypothetical protein [Caulobacteraceae bacterium]
MPMPLTFSGLRADLQGRSWYRRSDLIAAGGPLGEWGVRQAIKHLPKPKIKHYGHFHYGPEHMAAVVEAAAKLGVDTKDYPSTLSDHATEKGR